MKIVSHSLSYLQYIGVLSTSSPWAKFGLLNRQIQACDFYFILYNVSHNVIFIPAPKLSVQENSGRPTLVWSVANSDT